MIYTLGALAPRYAGDTWVADSASVVGDVRFGHRTSVWFNAVVRADNDSITLGDDCNVQDGAVLHVDDGFPLTLGAGVSIGHMAMLHGCTVGENTLIGIKAVILNGAVIGRDCLVGANSLITEHKVIPPGALGVGSPGRVVRALTAEEIAGLRENARVYRERAQLYRRELRRA